MFAQIQKQAVNAFIFAAIGYAASLGIAVSPEEAMAAIQNPGEIKVEKVTRSGVEAALEFRQDVIGVIEGPVATAVYTARDVLIENSHHFAVEIPDYTIVASNRY